ncbi:MAG: thiamine pyrophosphate-dependent enzyme, partial [Bdellovibrionales bacterium]|nr:thiamine pyrophosphate-dependent enzyme [Bdellovibrionales bacterium]
HWGGPAAFAEIMSATHGIMFYEKEWHKHFNFVNDAGHTENGIYALRANYGFDNQSFEDLYKFRSIESKLTGHGEAHLNPEGVFISNGPLGSGLPQAQGLAFADKLAGNKRVTICAISDGGCMEGEARESFAAIAGLAQKGKMNPFLMIISDNNTKLGGRISDDSFSMQPTFESLTNLGWDVIKVEEGHNLQDVYSQIEGAIDKIKENSSRPVALWVKTVKGYGVKTTEESKSGGHGFPLKPYSADILNFITEIYGQQPPQEFVDAAQRLTEKPPAGPASTIKKEKVQPGFSRAAIRAAKEGLPVFSVSSDLQGSTGIAAFHKEFPNHFVDAGIAEANMVSMAVGLSKQGFIPIVDTFSQFGITKGNLPLIMGALSQGPVIALFSHAGFQDAADGASHQATTYFAAVSAIPHTTVIQVACSAEAEAYMYQAIKMFEEKKSKGETPDNVIFFLGRENHPVQYTENSDYTWGKAQVLKQGQDVTIVAAGPMVQKALDAASELEKQGRSATVINNCFINHVDTETIADCVAKTGGKLITIEDHQHIGGMGSMIVHQLKIEGKDFKVKTLANPGEFGQSAYAADQLYNKYGLSVSGILKALEDL